MIQQKTLPYANIVVLDKGLDEILTVADALLKHLSFVRAEDVAQDPNFQPAPDLLCE
jgi:hypothetical protein